MEPKITTIIKYKYSAKDLIAIFSKQILCKNILKEIQNL